MRFLGIQNCEPESFGLFETVLPDLDVEFDCCLAFEGNALPPHTIYDALIIGGTPVSAADFRKKRSCATATGANNQPQEC